GSERLLVPRVRNFCDETLAFENSSTMGWLKRPGGQKVCRLRGSDDVGAAGVIGCNAISEIPLTTAPVGGIQKRRARSIEVGYERVRTATSKNRLQRIAQREVCRIGQARQKHVAGCIDSHGQGGVRAGPTQVCR